MKRGHIYTLGFMVLLTGILVFALAFAYEGFKPAITGNEQLRERRAVLDSLGLDQGLSDGEVNATFESLIKPSDVNGNEAYEYMQDGEVKGYALPFTGAGLWGSISGYLGVNADMTRTTGIVFTSQNETPGLGGRIDEAQYKEQFRGLPVDSDRPIEYGDHSDYRVDAITGATQTSSAVLRMVNRMMQDVIFAGEAD
jgi:Na+-transporting NADH:ubiquinone oxidoreductase subunit C